MSIEDPVRACLEGRIAPEVAIARLLLFGDDAARIRSRIQAARVASDRWEALDRQASQDAVLQRLRSMLDAAQADHSEAATPAAIAALFNRAVAICPEASVAIYSLGDRARLQAATEEIRDWLCQTGQLAPQMNVLDLGCGIGRVAASIAPHVRFVVGIDVAQAMLREAGVRCAGLDNTAFTASSGRDLAALADEAFDLVLAVDSLPYFVQAGVAECHFAEIHRVLRRGGNLIILNFSYRNDPLADRIDASTWAKRYGFRVSVAGISPFRRWDGQAWLLQRPLHDATIRADFTGCKQPSES